jgi:choline monooxygenase
VTLFGFDFEPDLSRASTIPSAWYLDPGMFREERRRVFGRTWQAVGHIDALRSPGDFFAGEVAGEPLVFTRAEDGTVRALSNVCRHRAGPVARGAGNRKALQCGYHGWTYGLDGTLRGTPEWEGVEEFDRSRHGLPAFRAAPWGPFLFVNLDPAAPDLARFLGPIPEETRHLPVAQMRLVKRVDYEISCNWKVYVDNYLEGYHIPIVHPGLFRLLDYRAYRVETSAFASKQHAPIRKSEAARGESAGASSGGEALYYWLFPNLMLNFYPDNLQTNVVLPVSEERMIARFEWYALEPERPGGAEELERSLAFADQVQREDVEICEAVQRGLASRTYRSGRYSVLRENGVHHFHGLLAQFLREPTDGAPGGAPSIR